MVSLGNRLPWDGHVFGKGIGYGDAFVARRHGGLPVFGHDLTLDAITRLLDLYPAIRALVGLALAAAEGQCHDCWQDYRQDFFHKKLCVFLVVACMSSHHANAAVAGVNPLVPSSACGGPITKAIRAH